MQKEIHPWEQLDEDIKEIRRMMSRSTAENSSEEKLSRRRPTIEVGNIQ